MEPFEIQPDAFVEKQKEVIAQLTNENILLTCRVEQLEQMLQPATTDSFGAPVADDPRVAPEWWGEEAEAAERAKDDFPEMNDDITESAVEHAPSLKETLEAAGMRNVSRWDVT